VTSNILQTLVISDLFAKSVSMAEGLRIHCFDHYRAINTYNERIIGAVASTRTMHRCCEYFNLHQRLSLIHNWYIKHWRHL